VKKERFLVFAQRVSFCIRILDINKDADAYKGKKKRENKMETRKRERARKGQCKTHASR
jgi:hypothetical protein